MVLANQNFNHEIDSFHESLGISDDIRTKCRERIFFTTMANALQREELFEDADDAPKSMRTVSGDLQRLLQSISDPLEYEFTLIIFTNFQRMGMEAMAYYRHLRDNKNDRESRIKEMIMELVDEIRSKHESDDEDDDDNDQPIDKLSKKNLLKRISLVKNSHYNFDTYMNLLKHWVNSGQNDNTGKKPNIDDLLRNLFSKDED